MKRSWISTFAFSLALSGPWSPAYCGDWLIDPKPYAAEIQPNEKTHDLTLSNGLAKRVLRLAPNAATYSVENLSSGEQLVRAIAPEARITINGTPYVIGGLEGQPVANYLKLEWLDTLTPVTDSYQLADWKIGPIEARFPWKRRSEWLSRDLSWPPPGKHVALRFVPPAAPAPAATGKALLEQAFTEKLGPDWKTVVSKHGGASFGSAGKLNELTASPDTCVYAEHAWPADAVVAEVRLDTGDDDQANSWGPGLALVAPDRTISFVARPHSQQFELVAPDTGEALKGGFTRGKPVVLRMRLERNRVICEASLDEKTFERIGVAALPKTPSLLRVGKVGKGGRGQDYEKPTGEPKHSHLHSLVLRAAPAQAAPQPPRTDLPEVTVHYEIYDGLPLFSKWLTVQNTTKNVVRINAFVSEELRLAEVESAVENPPTSEKYNLLVETDYTFAGMDGPHANARAVRIETDPHYPTQVNYARQTACLLKCGPALGPDQDVAAGATFESCRIWELLFDSTDRERRGLAQRRMYRTLAPWTCENPLMFHKLGSKPEIIRDAIAQCRATGFEMIIMTFGSGFNFENTNADYRQTYKQLAAEAKAANVALGGYFLLASRGAGDAKDNTQGQPAKYGVMPCLGADWGVKFFDKIRTFVQDADLGVIENDGPYPGDLCASKTHPHHHGLEDSQWVQWRAQADLYRWCRARGVYVNQPDYYFLNGGNKTGMGYRENNWSLPRAEQEIIERQNIYDGTWTKQQSMGWMFVPLSQYHGGGAAATIEPLAEHLDHYEARLANLLGSGTQACYRGPRLFDTDQTKAVVQKWVEFYKTHRQVLDGDLIHLRRATGRDWDGWLHVNPDGTERGLAFFYNPLTTDVERDIRVPLYYTGLMEKATVAVNGQMPRTITLDTQQSATLKIKIPARSWTWVLFTK